MDHDWPWILNPGPQCEIVDLRSASLSSGPDDRPLSQMGYTILISITS